MKCRKGICTSPLEIVASEVILTADPYGSHVAKALLFPGALVADVTERFAPTEGQRAPESFLPDWNSLLDRYGYTNLNISDPELNSRMEFNAGANLVVFGAMTGLVHANKMVLMGMALMTYFFYKEQAWLPKEGEELSPDKSYIFLLYLPFLAVSLFPALDVFAKQQKELQGKMAVAQKKEADKEESASASKSKLGKKDVKVIKRK